MVWASGKSVYGLSQIMAKGENQMINFDRGVRGDSSGALVNKMLNARAYQEPGVDGKVAISCSCFMIGCTTPPLSIFQGSPADLDREMPRRGFTTGPSGEVRCPIHSQDAFTYIIPDAIQNLSAKPKQIIATLNTEKDRAEKSRADITEKRKYLNDNLLTLTFDESRNVEKEIETLNSEIQFSCRRGFLLQFKLQGAILDDVRACTPGLNDAIVELEKKIGAVNLKIVELDGKRAKLADEVSILAGQIRVINNRKRALEEIMEKNRDLKEKSETLKKNLGTA